MGILATTQYSGTHLLIVNVAATTDNDTQASIAHGMGSLIAFAAGRVCVTLTRYVGDPATDSSDWVLSTVTASTVFLSKTSATGSSTTGTQIQVIIALPHSIVQ